MYAAAPMKAERNESLDALRGLSILAMVLSGSIAFGGLLPGWMYHAQVPPPNHTFIPTIPGITWVDLVFPFFLFSMGAAIPLALQKWINQPNANLQVFWIAIRRWVLLTWFALFIYHMRAWIISESPDEYSYLLSISGFILLFFQLYNPDKNNTDSSFWLFIKIGAYLIAIAILYLIPFNKGAGFQLDKSDIIIIVLGNMAFFGTLIWWFTKTNPWLRVGVLPFIMAIFLGGKEGGTINETILNFSPIPWMYKFYYLKYLFIIIPGTFAGEWMLKFKYASTDTKQPVLLGLISLGLIISNLICLYSRFLLLNIIISAVLLIITGYLVKREKQAWLSHLWMAACYMLMFGLAFEAFEGGIKKDPSTYSYYLVTTGLGFVCLLMLSTLQNLPIVKSCVQFICTNGRNPMVAYVAGSLLLTPLLHLSGFDNYINALNQNAWQGFLKGVIFTGIVSMVTYFFTIKKWYWKT